jgi:hypothetical protein
LPLFPPQRYALSGRGIDLLAYCRLLTPARFRASRAWQPDPAPLIHSRRHLEQVLAFMLALEKAGCLASWELSRARFSYRLTPGEAGADRSGRLQIVPDSSGVLALVEGELPFWLELDRGSHTGADLTRQLAKYVLARKADAGSGPLPVVLYVVAAGPASDRRARDVARRLMVLTVQHRLRQPPAVLLATWSDLTAGREGADADPMRPVWRPLGNWDALVGLQALAQAAMAFPAEKAA